MLATLTALAWTLGGYVLNNLPAILAFAGLVKVGLDNSDKAKSEAAKTQAFAMAVDAVKAVAAKELDNKAKRDAAIHLVLSALPANVSKYVPEELVGILVEKAYQQVVKPAQ